jgi:hypothetical protein
MRFQSWPKDFGGLGFRVPMIVVSPFAKRGYVTHTQYETTSMLRFIERAPVVGENQVDGLALRSGEKRASLAIYDTYRKSRISEMKPLLDSSRMKYAGAGLDAGRKIAMAGTPSTEPPSARMSSFLVISA